LRSEKGTIDRFGGFGMPKRITIVIDSVERGQLRSTCCHDVLYLLVVPQTSSILHIIYTNSESWRKKVG
jgi:hypothetical protein